MHTDLDSHFVRGSEYPPAECVQDPRPACCSDCAFKAGGETVRPKDVSLRRLIRFTADFDGFMCHQRCADGKFHECAGWHAHHGRADA